MTNLSSRFVNPFRMVDGVADTSYSWEGEVSPDMTWTNALFQSRINSSLSWMVDTGVTILGKCTI